MGRDRPHSRAISHGYRRLCGNQISYRILREGSAQPSATLPALDHPALLHRCRARMHMALSQQERLRLDQLRSIEHRSLAMYALELEGRLQRWRDLQASLSLGAMALCVLVGWMAGKFL